MTGPFADYPAACARAATDQHLDPVTAYLRNRGFAVEIEQTGGMCMVAAVYAADRLRRVWITEDDLRPGRYYAAVYGAYVDLGDVDDGEAAWDRDEGTEIVSGCTVENLPDIIAAELGIGPPAGPGTRWCDPHASVLSVELDACGDDPTDHARDCHEVRAVLVHDGGPHGWPVYRYTGTIAALLGWLDCAYQDGSGELWEDRLAEMLRI